MMTTPSNDSERQALAYNSEESGLFFNKKIKFDGTFLSNRTAQWGIEPGEFVVDGDETFLVCDLETTGLKHTDQIIEVCMCLVKLTRINEGDYSIGILDKQYTKINPKGVSSHPQALAIHGLTDESLKCEPTIEEVGIDILKLFAKSKRVLGHSINGLDTLMMKNHCFFMPIQTIDTYEIARRLFCGQKTKYSLKDLSKMFELDFDEDKLHGAEYDCMLNVRLWIEFRKIEEICLVLASHEINVKRHMWLYENMDRNRQNTDEEVPLKQQRQVCNEGYERDRKAASVVFAVDALVQAIESLKLKQAKYFRVLFENTDVLLTCFETVLAAIGLLDPNIETRGVAVDSDEAVPQTTLYGEARAMFALHEENYTNYLTNMFETAINLKRDNVKSMAAVLRFVKFHNKNCQQSSPFGLLSKYFIVQQN